MNTTCCSKVITPIKKYDAHFHDQWEIVITLSGKIETCYGDEKHNIEKGKVAVIPPGTVHSGEAISYFTDMYIRAENLPFTKLTIVKDSEGHITALADMLLKIVTEKEDNYETISDRLLFLICEYIKKYSEANCNYSFIAELKNDIYKNYENPGYKISDTIKKMGYNVDYIRRCFVEEIGKTPHAYMTFLRLNKAKNLLLDSYDYRISEIAETCGFGDSFYFSKLFKKHFGVTPSES